MASFDGPRRPVILNANRIGASAFSDFDGTAQQFLDLIQRLGYTGVEWRRFIGARTQILADKGPVLKAMAAHRGLPATVHLPAHLNLVDPDPAARERCFAEYLTGLRTAAAAGADIVVIHGGQHPDEEAGYAMSLAALQALQQEAAAVGVQLALENSERAPFKLFQRPDDFRRVADTELKIVLDIGHLWTWGISFRDVLQDEFIAQRLVEVHLHDNDGTGDQHLALGDGTIDFADAFAVLEEIGFDGVYTVEAKSVQGLVRSAAFLGLIDGVDEDVCAGHEVDGDARVVSKSETDVETEA